MRALPFEPSHARSRDEQPTTTRSLAPERMLVQLTIADLESAIERGCVRAVENVLGDLEKQRQRDVAKQAGADAPLTFKEAMAELRCKDRTLRYWLKKGLIKRMRTHNRGSSRVLILRSEIERFRAESRQP